MQHSGGADVTVALHRQPRTPEEQAQEQQPRGHRPDCCLRTNPVTSAPSLRDTGIAPVAVSRAPAELCRFDWLHTQRRFGCSGAEALLGSSRAWSTAIATSPIRSRHPRPLKRRSDRPREAPFPHKTGLDAARADSPNFGRIRRCRVPASGLRRPGMWCPRIRFALTSIASTVFSRPPTGRQASRVT